jgi:hypothetical protein
MSGLVGADELGLCALAGRLDEAAARLATHQRALVAASGAGAEVQLPLRTVTTLAAWSTEQAADVRGRLQVLALYRAGWLPAWAAGAGGVTPPPSPLEPISRDLGTLVTLLKILLPGLEEGLNALIHNPAARAAIERLLGMSRSVLGRVSVVIDAAAIVAPPHDGARGAGDRLAGAIGVGGFLIGLVAPEVGAVIGTVVIGYWVATFLYDERAVIADVTDAVWDEARREFGEGADRASSAFHWGEALVDDMAAAAADAFDDVADAVAKVRDLWSSLKGTGCDLPRIPILSAAVPPVFRSAAWDLCPRLR